MPSLVYSPVYLKLVNQDSSGNAIDLTHTNFVDKNSNIYNGTLANTISGTTNDINQSLNIGSNIFDISTVFSNTGDIDKTVSSSTEISSIINGVSTTHRIYGHQKYNGIYHYELYASDNEISNSILKYAHFSWYNTS